MRRKTILSRITVTVCVPMAGVGGTERPLPDGTRFLAISGILVFALVSSWRRGYCGRFFDWHHGLRHCFVVAREGVSVDSPKVTVSCRLGAYSLYFGYSTTERVLSSVCEPWGSLSPLKILQISTEAHHQSGMFPGYLVQLTRLGDRR